MSDSPLFKHRVSQATIDALAPRFASALPGFDEALFATRAAAGLEELALKARIQQIAAAAQASWSGPVAQLIDALPTVATAEPGLAGFAVWPLLQVIEDFGLPARQASLAAMRALTGRWSAEFAIRPISTRRYHAGLHRVEVQVNGRVLSGADFRLAMPDA